MDNLDKPSIIVALHHSESELADLSELLNGIEEEEIPVSSQVFDGPTATVRAYQASLASRLSVGIGFDNQQVVLHYKNLKPDEPLFTVARGNATVLRALGANAARLVKGTPFKEIGE